MREFREPLASPTPTRIDSVAMHTDNDKKHIKNHGHLLERTKHC